MKKKSTESFGDNSYSLFSSFTQQWGLEMVDGSSWEGEEYDILLIESDPDSVSSFIDSFEKTRVTNRVTTVTNGDEAFNFINRLDKYEDGSQPDLVFLDLHLPDTDGLEILAEIKNHTELKRIPVIVLTSPDEAEEVAQTYDLHANAYVRKPESPERFERLVQAIENFWLDQVILPPKE